MTYTTDVLWLCDDEWGAAGALPSGAYGSLAIKAVSIPVRRRASGNDAGFAEWVTQPAAATIEALRESRAALVERPHTVLWLFRPSVNERGWVLRETAIEAARGIVQSVTREFTGRMCPLNAVVAPSNDPESVRHALEFLAHPRGAFTAGSTLNLCEVGGAAG